MKVIEAKYENVLGKRKPKVSHSKVTVPANPQIITLKNKIQVALFPDSNIEVFRIDIVFKAGILQAKHPVLPSLLGSMLAEGIQNMNASDIAEAFDFHGAYYTQETNRDRSLLQIHAPSKYFEKLIQLLSQITFNPTFPDSSFKKLKTQYLQQNKIDQNKVKFLAAQEFMKQIFGEAHPYGMTVNQEVIKECKLADIKKLHQELYYEENCNIILSGNFSEVDIQTLNNTFGNHRTLIIRELENTNLKISPAKNKKVHVPLKNTVQSAIRIGFPTINKHHPDYPHFQLLVTILGGYFGSRLMKNIREEKGYTYGIGSAVLSLEASGYFVIVTEVGSQVCNKAVDEIFKEIDALIQYPVKKSELKTVKNYVTGEFLRMFDGAFEKASAWRSVNDFGLDFSFYKTYIKSVLNAKPEQLQDIAKRYLVNKSMYKIIAGLE